MITIGFQKHTKKEILAEAINKRMRHKNKVFTLFFKLNGYQFGIIYEPETYIYHSHFDFYCMSENLKDYTETGYKSIFASSDQKVYSREAITEYLVSILNKEGFNINEEAKPVQLTLF